MEVKRMVIREAKVNFKIFWVLKAVWEDSSNKKHDMGWKGQKGSMENLGFWKVTLGDALPDITRVGWTKEKWKEPFGRL